MAVSTVGYQKDTIQHSDAITVQEFVKFLGYNPLNEARSQFATAYSH